MKKFDLCWGESVCVRKSFLNQTAGINVNFGLEELSTMDYTPFSGDAKLIEETAKVILRQTGKTYKHIFLTNGASGGCTIALRAYAAQGCLMGYTNKAPYFPLYPRMMAAAGMRHGTTGTEYKHYGPGPFLLDTPANPSGHHVGKPTWANGMSTVWDAVYANNVYSALVVPAPEHEIVVGSYSKLTGLNGIRLGWIATDSSVMADTIGDLIAPEYCGLSKPSMTIMLQLLDIFNNDPDYHWGAFEKSARFALDGNREEWSRLEKYFDGTPVSSNGMFYYSAMDASAKSLFEKAGVLWQSGSNCGTSDDFARFNLGQDQKLILDAVNSILRVDSNK